MKKIQPLKGEQFFKEVLKCFNLDCFTAITSMNMLLVVHQEWQNFLIKTTEFGILKDIENMDFFVCKTSKTGIAFKGDLTSEEKEQLLRLQKSYKDYYELNINVQGDVLNKFFPENI
tara:strand:+ start:589 stop:939 length:351 start_codon:yes stop_codon:yes gene_type:complete